MKIAFIGGGNMGEAIIAALLEKKLAAPGDICASDVIAGRLHYLEEKYAVAVTGNNEGAVAGRDIIVLAVKPQQLAGVMAGLKGSLQPSQLVVSIIAGTTVKTIAEGLGHGAVVRAMPNMPARIGQGMTAWTATRGLTPTQKEWSGKILGAMGQEIYFDDEKYLDMVTAVSGSGPAYFFMFAEALIEAAVKIGLPPREAEQMVGQTILGAVHLLVQSGQSPAELRRDVTSPGGTTEAALKVFESGGFSGLVAEAVRAAYRRAEELGR